MGKNSLKKKITLTRAKLTELVNGIEIIENPEIGRISATKNLGAGKSISIDAKIDAEKPSSYFEIELTGKIIPYDVKIYREGYDAFFGKTRAHYFNQGKDVGLTEDFSVSMMSGKKSEFFYNDADTAIAVKLDYANLPRWPFGRFYRKDYAGEFRPLIRALELRLGRLLIDKSCLAKHPY